jgi:hypothetical protein
MIRIDVDYNTVTGDPAERFVIPARFSSSLSGTLYPGQRVMLVEPNEYEVEADLEHDALRNAWYGRPHWETFHDLSAAPATALAATIDEHRP